jgi:C1A family cysteine protease
MTILKNKGQAIVGNAAAAVKNRISAYYAIPINVESLKRAIFTYGGIVVAAPWANSYFKPGANGVLPKPDTLAGGHAFYVVGWNDTLKVFICINSWSLPWGYQGRGVFFLPYSVVSDPNWGLWEAWKAVDLPHN